MEGGGGGVEGGGVCVWGVCGGVWGEGLWMLTLVGVNTCACQHLCVPIPPCPTVFQAFDGDVGGLETGGNAAEGPGKASGA